MVGFLKNAWMTKSSYRWQAIAPTQLPQLRQRRTSACSHAVAAQWPLLSMAVDGSTRCSWQLPLWQWESTGVTGTTSLPRSALKLRRKLMKVVYCSQLKVRWSHEKFSSWKWCILSESGVLFPVNLGLGNSWGTRFMMGLPAVLRGSRACRAPPFHHDGLQMAVTWTKRSATIWWDVQTISSALMDEGITFTEKHRYCEIF